jgi:hypothetical protein
MPFFLHAHDFSFVVVLYDVDTFHAVTHKYYGALGTEPFTALKSKKKKYKERRGGIDYRCENV